MHACAKESTIVFAFICLVDSSNAAIESFLVGTAKELDMKISLAICLPIPLATPLTLTPIKRLICANSTDRDVQ